MVYLCYIDESGTSEIPGNTTHYILCGVSLPIKYWKSYNKRINQLKHKYRIDNSEIRREDENKKAGNHHTGRGWD